MNARGPTACHQQQVAGKGRGPRGIGRAIGASRRGEQPGNAQATARGNDTVFGQHDNPAPRCLRPLSLPPLAFPQRVFHEELA